MKLGNIFKRKEKKEKPWNLKQEERALEQNLKTMSVNDKEYKPTLDAIEQLNKTQDAKAESRANRAKAIGTLVLGFGVAMAAYAIDRSDSIQRNKCSASFFGKVFKI